ncbi:DmsC/YnfH family molybdoenzyme membrane anchor subunit [Shigella flexneri]
MIFTVFGDVRLVLSFWLWRCSKATCRAEAQQRVMACMFGLWVLMGIGFIASMLHLGSPMRALTRSTG